MVRVFTGLFIAEGSSDRPLATLVEDLFRDWGVAIRLVPPDFGQLREKVNNDIQSQLEAGIKLLTGTQPDLVVIHRDADNAGSEARRDEISAAVRQVDPNLAFCPVIPIRMTEAWLLLDERAIRYVAGKLSPRRPRQAGAVTGWPGASTSIESSYLRTSIGMAPSANCRVGNS